MRSDNRGRRERTRPGFLVCVLCAAVIGGLVQVRRGRPDGLPPGEGGGGE